MGSISVLAIIRVTSFMRAGCSYAQFSVPDLRDAMQAAYGPEETMPALSEAEGNESDYTVKESHEAYSDKESQASRAEDEQVVVASC